MSRINTQRRLRTEQSITTFLEHHKLKGNNFVDTPKRVAQFWEEFLHPSKVDIATFPLRTAPGMIVHRKVILWGFCPHHLLPVRYTFKIGYIPEREPLGASKPIRMALRILSKMPLQEELPQMLIEEMGRTINMKGAGCIVKGEHLCMQMRGIRQPHADMVTDYLTGCFMTDPETRAEFMAL